MIDRTTRCGSKPPLLRRVILCLPIILAISSCATPAEWRRFWNRGPDQQPQAEPRSAAKSLAVRGTIAPLVTVDGMRLNQVRGFGLVLDLIDTGGRDGPELVRKYLTKEIHRRQNMNASDFSPLSMLNTRDSTMVEVTGFIPAGAVKGDRFDIIVHALGSEAHSLVGGRLVLGDLRVYAETPSGVLGGKSLATAKGPVFVSPFDRRGDPTNVVDLRRGVVLGGGRVTSPRKIRLVLNNPRHSIAIQIERRLNSRYGGDTPIAIGESAGKLALKIPLDYRHRKWLFLEHVLHTTLNGNVTFLKKRTHGLLEELQEHKSDGDSIALALEAIGKLVLPELRPLYDDPNVKVGYFAARTGLRLDDRDAQKIVSKQARDPNSPFRRQAISELGWAVKNYAAGEQLRKLLDDPDDLIRIAAYNALRRRPHPAINSRVLDEDNLVLDIVDSNGPFLIYVQRTTMPRITLFGKTMRCQPPLMFPGNRHDGRRLICQLSAQANDKQAIFKYTNKRNGSISPDLPAPLEVAELVEYLGGAPHDSEKWKRTGYAVPYSEIIDMLSFFCETQTIPAKFVLQGLEEKINAENAIEREESEF